MKSSAFVPMQAVSAVTGYLSDSSITSRNWRRLALALALLTAGGVAVLLVVRYQIQQQVGGALSAVLHSQAQIVRTWVDERLLDARLTAARSELVNFAAQVDAGTPPDAAQAAALRQLVSQALADGDETDWWLTNAEGEIALAAEPEEGAQRVVSELLDPIGQVVKSGKPQFLPPFLAGARDNPMMAFITPVPGAGGKPSAAALVVRKDPRGGFSKLFLAGRIGETGDTYAFDGEARMISESRALGEWKTQRPELANATTSVFTVHLRDYAAAPTGTLPSALPMTAAAASAAAAHLANINVLIKELNADFSMMGQ